MELELGEGANDHNCRELRRNSTDIDVQTLAAVGITISSHPTVLTISWGEGFVGSLTVFNRSWLLTLFKAEIPDRINVSVWFNFSC